MGGFTTVSAGIHDDSNHKDSAKRGAVNGVAGLDASGLAPHIVNKIASANIRNSHDAEASSTSTVYIKVKTITLTSGLHGQQRFLFDIRSAGFGSAVYGRIYHNGVALGTEQSDTTGEYVTKSQDITREWAAGDTCELWIKRLTGATAYIRNFRIAYDDSPTVAVGSSNS